MIQLSGLSVYPGASPPVAYLGFFSEQAIFLLYLLTIIGYEVPGDWLSYSGLPGVSFLQEHRLGIFKQLFPEQMDGVTISFFFLIMNVSRQ